MSVKWHIYFIFAGNSEYGYIPFCINHVTVGLVNFIKLEKLLEER